MEGGDENDLRILEMPCEEEERERLSTGSEPPKREEPRMMPDAERKPPADKENKEKVCVFLLLCIFFSVTSK